MKNDLQTKTSSSLKEIISELEKKMILESMRASNWVQVRAAQRLGISQRVLGYKLKKYRIKRRTK